MANVEIDYVTNLDNESDDGASGHWSNKLNLQKFIPRTKRTYNESGSNNIFISLVFILFNFFLIIVY